MNIISTLFVSILLATTLLFSFNSTASGEHESAENKQHEQAGPHGGKLLTKDNIALEITIFEIGDAPEMRVYAYRDNDPMPVDEIQLEVRLTRLNGKTDIVTFSTEQDYLLGSQSIAEPHSFDVKINATLAGKYYQWQYQSHEGRTQISQRAIEASNIQTEIASAGELTEKQTLFGVIAPTTDRQFKVMSPYSGLIKSILINIGDKVRKNQPLIQVQNSQTLQHFTIKSPADGVITNQWVNVGERAEQQALLEITDLSKVWVELSAFPENIEKIAVGQQAKIYDLHHHLQTTGQVFYLAPMMTGGHIARARILIDNTNGHWRPGMHVKSDITTEVKQLPLRVKKQAIQTLMNKPVVFARFVNTFEARPLELGQANDTWVEVLSGLDPGVEYVTQNSFVIKADVLKAGASHAH